VLVARWFLNHLRGLRRRERRLDRSVQADLLLEARAGPWSPAVYVSYPPRCPDPFTALLRQEQATRLSEVVRDLDEVGQRLCAALAAGRRLKGVAHELGISEDAAGRLWKKVKARLRACVPDLAAEGGTRS
jgi:hypothetical protein